MYASHAVSRPQAPKRTGCFALAIALIVNACAAVPPARSIPPKPQGSAVALGVAVQVGELVVTPTRIVEDSRCPINARCVWAGRLVVSTRIEGYSDAGKWRDTADLRLGETFGTHGRVVALVAGEPGRIAGSDTPPEAYRLTYEAR